MIEIAKTDADSSIVDESETRAVSVSIGDPIMTPVAITRRLGDLRNGCVTSISFKFINVPEEDARTL
jgi:hypothetical protein